MVSINLLPRHEYVHAYQSAWTKKLLYISISFTLFLVFAAHFYTVNRVAKVHNHVLRLQEEVDRYSEMQRSFQYKNINLTSEDSEKNRIHSRKTIQDLWMELGKKYSTSVCFTEITRENNAIIFSGNAETAADLTEFFKHWSAVSLFSEVRIEQLEYQSSYHQMQFRFRAI